MTRPSEPGRVYLDACVLIEYLQQNARPEVARAMQLIQAGNLRAYISTAHYVEVLGDGQSGTFSADQETQARDLLRHPRLTMVEAARHIMLRARGYRLHWGLKALDAIHVATAVDVGADVLWTYDKKLLNLQQVEDVWIDEPYEPGPDTPLEGFPLASGP